MKWTLWTGVKGKRRFEGREFPTKKAAEEYFINTWDYEERQQLKHKIEKTIRSLEVSNV